jgi:biotin carboxyl carrier protein
LKLKISVNNKTYEVDVEVEESVPAGAPPLRTRAVESAAVRAPAVAAPAAAMETGSVVEEKVARSPVSGVVVRAAVQVGQTLQEGDVLMVLEAMKMETSVTAPAAGTVAAIKVKAGDSVQSGQILIEFE